LDGVSLTKLQIFQSDLGDVMHAIKRSDPFFSDFGEAYFSKINEGIIKGWKKHTQMTCNLVVPIGTVRFVIFDTDCKQSRTFILGAQNYVRLTIMPQHWFAFQGYDDTNLILNISNIPHDPSEHVSKALEDIAYEW
jgi:dTDP-4-dehydrorhamnose 3,5-epimerase